MIKAGKNFHLEKDEEIVKIKAPKKHLGGSPWLVVHKDVDERWAIVAMQWNNEPCLGIRWFHRTNGNPTSSFHPTWLVIPHAFEMCILQQLQIGAEKKQRVIDYLQKKITHYELQAGYKKGDVVSYCGSEYVVKKVDNKVHISNGIASREEYPKDLSLIKAQ